MVNLSGNIPEDISSNLILYKQINMINKNNNNYNLIFLIFLVLLLLSVGILMVDSFFIHQSISEFLELNKELHEKFEHLEIIQQEKIQDLENNVNKKLEEIANNNKMIKKKIQNPTQTEWVFITGTLFLCFYVIISLGISK